MRVLVTHRQDGRGVALVPRAELKALRADGVRETTATVIAGWYRLRGLVPLGHRAELL